MFASKSKVERRIVRSFWGDGLLDILAGGVVFLIGVAWKFDLVPLGAIAPAVAIPFWTPLRTWITEPRLGHVEFSDGQTNRFRSLLIGAFFIGCLTLVFGTALYFYVVKADRPLSLQNWVAAIPAWAIGFVALLTSITISVRRFIGYAAAFSILGVMVVVLDRRPEFSMLIGGAMITIVGLVQLVTFVQSHPRQPIQTNGA